MGAIANGTFLFRINSCRASCRISNFCVASCVFLTFACVRKTRVFVSLFVCLYFLPLFVYFRDFLLFPLSSPKPNSPIITRLIGSSGGVFLISCMCSFYLFRSTGWVYTGLDIKPSFRKRNLTRHF